MANNINPCRTNDTVTLTMTMIYQYRNLKPGILRQRLKQKSKSRFCCQKRLPFLSQCILS